MANEKKIIQEVKGAVDQLSNSFKVLDDILDKNMANQKKLISNLNAIKKNLSGTKGLKEFVALQKQLDQTQSKLNKTQRDAVDLAKKNEQRKQQTIKTQQAAIQAAKKEQIENEKLKQSKQQTIKTQQAAIQAAKKEQIENEKLKQSKMRTAAATRRETAQKAKAEQQSREASRAYNVESKRLLELTKKAKDAAMSYGINSKQARKLRIEQQKLDRQLKAVDKSLGQHTRNVGNYRSAWGGVKNVLMGATGFIGGAALAQKAISNIGTEMRKNTNIQQKLRQQYNLTGDALSDIAEQVQVISNVYEKDYNEIISSANALSKQFGIEASESLDLINEGFEKGADNSGEFLSMLKEYPSQLKSVGLNADQSISIMTQSVNRGVFSDKGIDAIKEAGLRLRELTPATRDALEMIGLSSEEIEESLREGSKSLFDIIQEVSTQLKTLPPQSREVGTALADIFGGPGEDAGLDYIKILGDVNMSLQDVKANTDPYIESQRNLKKQWTETVLQIQGGNKALIKFNELLSTTLSVLNVQIDSFRDEDKNFFEKMGDHLKGMVAIAYGAITGNLKEVVKELNNINEGLKIDIDVVSDMEAEYDSLNLSLDKTTAALKAMRREREQQEGDAPPPTPPAGVEPFDISSQTDSYRTSLEEMNDMDQDYLDQYLDREKERTDFIKSEEEKRKELRMQTEEEVKNFGMAIADSFFEMKSEQYQKDLENNRQYYDGLLANEQLSEEQRSLLEAQRLEKEQEIQRKQRENEKKQFLFKQGIKAAEIGIETAAKVAELRGIAAVAKAKAIGVGPIALLEGAKAAAAIAQIPLLKTLAAVQIGTLLAQSIPKFAKGTDSAPGGLSVVGEKGTELVKNKNGESYLTGDKPELRYLEKGAQVIPNNDLMKSVSNYTNSQIVNNGDKVTGQDALVGRLITRLLEDNHNGNKDIIKAIEKNRPLTKRESTIDRMRTEQLKNKLRS